MLSGGSRLASMSGYYNGHLKPEARIALCLEAFRLGGQVNTAGLTRKFIWAQEARIAVLAASSSVKAARAAA